MRQNGAFSVTKKNQTYTNSLFYHISLAIQQKVLLQRLSNLILQISQKTRGFSKSLRFLFRWKLPEKMCQELEEIYNEGEQSGFLRGEQSGKLKAKKETTLSLLEMGMSIEKKDSQKIKVRKRQLEEELNIAEKGMEYYAL